MVGSDAPKMLFDEVFLGLWRITNQRLVSWDEFKNMEMPAGMGPRDAWEAIEALKRQIGIPLGGHSLGDPESRFVSLPLEQLRRARRILARSGRGSQLFSMASRLPRGLFLEGRVLEIGAAMRRDGQALPYETIRRLLNEERMARCEAERVVVGYARVLKEELVSSAEHISACALYANMTGLTLKGLEIPPTGANDRRLLRWTDECLSTVPDVRGIDMLANAASLWGRFESTQAEGRWDMLFGSLACRVYLIRCGYADLALVRTCQENALPFSDSIAAEDQTHTMACYLDLLESGLDSLEEEAELERERQSFAHQAVDASAVLNYRQRQTVFAALDDETFLIDYESYQQKFQVTYNTARSDLGLLSELGLLVASMKGRCVAFHPVDSLVSVIERLSDGHML